MVMRLGVFVKMRWFAVLLIIGIALVAEYAFSITVNLLPVLSICAFIALYNLLLAFQVKRLDDEKPEQVVRRARGYGYIHITLDLVVAAALLHFSGGVENPFLFLFVFHIISASIVLHYRVVYWLSAMAVFLVAVVVGLEYAGVLPHYNLAGFAPADLYTRVPYVLAVMFSLALIIFITAYMTTAIAGELRKRQRQVVELGERLLEERTGQLRTASAEVAKLEEERNRFLRFIGIAAHDLKAPLTAIEGFLWVMLDGYTGELNEKQRSMVDRSAKRITELMGLISDLLDIPRIETGQIVQEVKDVSLNEVFKGSLDDLAKQAEQKNLKFEVQIPDGLPIVKASAARLKQVINNLVVNAINYTDEGGIMVCVTDGSDGITCSVIDTGIGIPPEDQSHLFDDFFRASNVTKKGTGLGLSIARRIIEAHGGKIWMESPPAGAANGSKFSFTLPKQTQEAAR
jgi:signal transduction histidine kinase